MKKYWLLLIVFLFPIIINAEAITYNICKSGCEYNDLETVSNEINSLTNVDDVIVNFKDSELYDGNLYYISEHDLNSFTVNGNNSTINAIDIEHTKTTIVNDLSVKQGAFLFCFWNA